MSNFSRRDFIKKLGVYSAGIALTRRSAFASLLVDDSDSFDFLVVGDSLIWGQGLKEENKFYYLTKQWLKTDVFGDSRPVNLKVKAHSGASIKLRPNESEALEKAEIGEDEFFHREINLSFPSITAQVDAARATYKNPESVNLIMLSGGVTDVRLTTILNPMKSNDELRSDIVESCYEKMYDLLEHTTAQFPNALIAVIGYYPFLSKYTPASVIFGNLLKIYDAPTALKIIINNPLQRRLLRHYRNKMVERSAIWAENSTAEFKKAIARLNAKFNAPRVVFVESPIKEENALGTKNPLLYDIGKGGTARDDLAAERLKVCGATLDELSKRTDLKFRTKTCELATVGHPNVEGALAYAGAIQNALRPLITT